MTIQSIQLSIVNGAKTTGTILYNSASWAGRTFATTVAPAISRIWALTQTVASKAFALAKTGPYYPLAIAAGLFGVGAAAWSFADAHEDSSWKGTALKLVAITAFVGGTASVGLSLAALTA